MDPQNYIDAHPLFYRDNFRSLFTVAFVLSILALILLALIFYQYKTRPVVKYFATTSNGQLIEIRPVIPGL